MIVHKLIFAIISLFLSISTYGQANITGIIKDANTKEIIPYAHIIGEGQATLSDEDGHFTLKNIGDTLLVSAIGYEEKHIIASNMDTVVYLNPAIYALPAIKVVPKKTKNIEIGTIKKGSVRYSFSSRGEGYQIAKYIANNNGIEGTLNSISFYLVSKTKRIQKIRLLVIAKDSASLKPANTIIPISKIVEVGRKKGWVEVDVSDLPIPFPKDGFYIGIEFLDQAKKIDINNRIEIGLFPFEKEALTWIKFLGSEWNVPPFSNHLKDGQLNLMVKLKIETPIE